MDRECGVRILRSTFQLSFANRLNIYCAAELPEYLGVATSSVKRIKNAKKSTENRKTDNPNAKTQAEVTSHVSERETGIAPNP